MPKAVVRLEALQKGSWVFHAVPTGTAAASPGYLTFLAWKRELLQVCPRLNVGGQDAVQRSRNREIKKEED